jgi:hypothetical protein
MSETRADVAEPTPAEFATKETESKIKKIKDLSS